jgi:hypothetical protein
MANRQHIEILQKGVETWNHWRMDNLKIQPDLSEADLKGVNLYMAHLENANLRGASLQGANLYMAHLENAFLVEAHLEKADLTETHLEGAKLSKAHLEGSILCRAYFDRTTKLDEIIFGNGELGSVSVADVDWGGVNVAVISWSAVTELGDERKAREQKWPNGVKKNKETQLDEYLIAVRANRQLAVVLRDQGLNEDAARFSYNAQNLQRSVFKQNRKFGHYLFYGFIDLIAGYGYKPERSLAWYLFVLIGCSILYNMFGHLPLPEAFYLSVTSLHGRGFFPGNNISLNSISVPVATFEAVIGLLIEISFIATFTSRFFGR